MDVKSTTEITRGEAEHAYVRLSLALINLKRKLRAEAALMCDAKLEAALETLNDQINDGEGCEYYSIIDAKR